MSAGVPFGAVWDLCVSLRLRLLGSAPLLAACERNGALALGVAIVTRSITKQAAQCSNSLDGKSSTCWEPTTLTTSTTACVGTYRSAKPPCSQLDPLVVLLSIADGIAYQSSRVQYLTVLCSSPLFLQSLPADAVLRRNGASEQQTRWRWQVLPDRGLPLAGGARSDAWCLRA